MTLTITTICWLMKKSAMSHVKRLFEPWTPLEANVAYAAPTTPVGGAGNNNDNNLLLIVDLLH